MTKSFNILKSIAGIIIGVGILAEVAIAQAPSESRLSISTSLMYLASSTEQGGSGAEGSTLLTETEVIYRDLWFNYGALLQYDSQGDSQKNTEIGYKLEYEIAPFYFEAAHAFYISRSYTDRSIASQTGNGYRFGMGVRVPLSAYPSIYMQFSFKHRVQVIEEQDDKPLEEEIVQKDSYPMMGIGFML